MKKEITFIDILNQPEAKKIVEQIEYIGETEDKELKRILKELKKELKDTYGWEWAE